MFNLNPSHPSFYDPFTPVLDLKSQSELYWQKYGIIHQQDHVLRQSLANWQGVVLFLLMGDSLVLIKRSENLKSYRGQMAFIGGKREKHESDLLTVAIREFEEETSMPESVLKIRGLLPLVYSARAHLIAPLIAEVSLNPFEFSQSVVSNGEWETIISIPLHFLLDEGNWIYAINRGSQNLHHTLLFRPLFSSEYQILKGPSASFLLWGATARMIWNFVQIVKYSAN